MILFGKRKHTGSLTVFQKKSMVLPRHQKRHECFHDCLNRIIAGAQSTINALEKAM